MSKKINKGVKIQGWDAPLPKSSIFIWMVCTGLLALLIWAWLFKLEEVSTGTGKIIPSSKEQVVQSLEGGILTKLYVHEGQIVPRLSEDPGHEYDPEDIR